MPTLVKICPQLLASRRLTGSAVAALLLSVLLVMDAAPARSQSPPTDDQPAATPARAVVKKPKPTPTPAPKPSPTPASAKPTPAAKATPTPKPTPTPTAKSTPAPKTSPAPSTAPTPKASPADTPKPRRVKKAVAEKPAAASPAPLPEVAKTDAASVPAASAPAAPTSVPSAPSGASPEAPAIPGYGPNEGLPLGGGGPGEGPQMELIPQGMTPLQPGLQFPYQSIVPSGPLIPQTAAQAAVKPEDLKYTISKFTLKYGPTSKTPHPKLPPIQTLAETPITLGESKEPGGGYVAPGAGNRDVPVVLSKFNKPETFSGGALQAIFYALVAEVNKRGISGVFAVQDADQIDPSTGQDLRKGATDLTLLVYASEVREVRTIVKPVPKWPFKNASTVINDPKYRRITVDSPLKPPAPEAATAAAPAKAKGSWLWPWHKEKTAAVTAKATPAPAKALTGKPLPKGSPIPPTATAQVQQPPPPNKNHGSLLDRNLLQDYLTRINRFPGRRVDVAVTASGEEGGVILDYIVHAERPPVFLFDQTSNTGAQASGTWRTRAGVELRQLAGFDDIFDASFETSLSSSTYSAFGSYQISALFPDLLKFKVYGGYGKFLAEDVGQDAEQFTGKSGTAGALAIYTPFYFKGFPLDIIAGVEYKTVDIINSGTSGSSSVDREGATNFLLPIVGLATDRSTDLFTAFASVQVEPNLAGVAGTDPDQLKNMGRFMVDKDFVIAKYSLGGSFFLEPILFRGSWKQYDESDEEARKPLWKKVTEAHELSLLVHGQYTFGDKRLVPQFEDVLGGFASVRGYPEAFTSGDDSIIINGEYRFHLPRVLKPADTDRINTLNPAATPKFAIRPPTILGRPDIDVILRGFVDYGYVKNNNIFVTTEIDRTLLSAGAGIEAQVSRYLNLRLDCGVPLISETEKTSRKVYAGHPRLSFVGVISY